MASSSFRTCVVKTIVEYNSCLKNCQWGGGGMSYLFTCFFSNHTPLNPSGRGGSQTQHSQGWAFSHTVREIPAHMVSTEGGTTISSFSKWHSSFISSLQCLFHLECQDFTSNYLLKICSKKSFQAAKHLG